MEIDSKTDATEEQLIEPTIDCAAIDDDCAVIDDDCAVIDDDCAVIDDKKAESWRDEVVMIKGKKRAAKNVLTRMKATETGGPLSMLYRCVAERLKVKVWTRSYNYIRGICTGYLVAYDKHFNMALVDVDEIYKNPVREVVESVKKKRIRRKKKSNNTDCTAEVNTAGRDKEGARSEEQASTEEKRSFADVADTATATAAATTATTAATTTVAGQHQAKRNVLDSRDAKGRHAAAVERSSEKKLSRHLQDIVLEDSFDNMRVDVNISYEDDVENIVDNRCSDFTSIVCPEDSLVAASHSEGRTFSAAETRMTDAYDDASTSSSSRIQKLLEEMKHIQQDIEDLSASDADSFSDADDVQVEIPSETSYVLLQSGVEVEPEAAECVHGDKEDGELESFDETTISDDVIGLSDTNRKSLVDPCVTPVEPSRKLFPSSSKSKPTRNSETSHSRCERKQGSSGNRGNHSRQRDGERQHSNPSFKPLRFLPVCRSFGRKSRSCSVRKLNVRSLSRRDRRKKSGDRSRSRSRNRHDTSSKHSESSRSKTNSSERSDKRDADRTRYKDSHSRKNDDKGHRYNDRSRGRHRSGSRQRDVHSDSGRKNTHGRGEGRRGGGDDRRDEHYSKTDRRKSREREEKRKIDERSREHLKRQTSEERGRGKKENDRRGRREEDNRKSDERRDGSKTSYSDVKRRDARSKETESNRNKDSDTAASKSDRGKTVTACPSKNRQCEDDGIKSETSRCNASDSKYYEPAKKEFDLSGKCDSRSAESSKSACDQRKAPYKPLLTRHINQVFLRGDNVVMISIVVD